MKEEIQLSLFDGILFTPEQEKMIAEFIKIREDIANTNESINKQREQLLINNGFVKGVDFENTFKIETITREMTLGYTYNKTDFKAEVTYKTIEGGIGVKVKKFNAYSAPNELIDYTFGIEFEKDKVNCSGVQDSYRYIKPTTLFDKLMEFNKRQKQLFEEYKKRNSLKQNIVDKYTKLYPNTTITVRNEYGKYSGSFDVVEVKFESGSFVQFRLDTYNNKEYIHKKYDAEFDKMKLEELLDKFSKQVKKEALD